MMKRRTATLRVGLLDGELHECSDSLTGVGFVLCRGFEALLDLATASISRVPKGN